MVSTNPTSVQVKIDVKIAKQNGDFTNVGKGVVTRETKEKSISMRRFSASSPFSYESISYESIFYEAIAYEAIW